MLGAIIGDVVGSIYETLEIKELKNNSRRSYEERIKILNPEEPLFTDSSNVTDDSILTCAVYDAIKNGNCDYEKYLREYGLQELEFCEKNNAHHRFGKGFVSWLNKENEGISYANGGAMRVSPVGFLFNSLEEVKKNSYLATIPSHNNPEALKSAEAVSVSIYLLRKGFSKEEVEQYIKSNYYELNYDLEDLQRNYTFSSRSSESVPEALFVFFQADNFEDSIRKAVSIGGDSDTIACIAGALSEAYYGVDEKLKDGVKPYLRDNMVDLLDDYYHLKDKLKEKKNERSN